MSSEELLIRGTMHELHCEDALYTHTIDEQWVFAAVMDGCSSGISSHFASSLYQKHLQKSIKMLPLLAQLNKDVDLDNCTAQKLSHLVLRHFFEDIKKTRTILLINKLELLSTLILAVYNKKTKECYIIISGDGYICVNKEISYFDQFNTPDYLAYHFKLGASQWIQKHTQGILFTNVDSFSIATDGINMLIDKNGEASKDQTIIEKLMHKSVYSLETIFSEIKLNNGLKPYDDIAIIKYSEKA